MNKVKISTSDYFAKDVRIKTSISLLACLSYNNIKALLDNSYDFQAILLSRMSELNSEIKQLSDILLDAILDNYVYSLTKEINKNNNFTLPTEKINNIKSIVNNVNAAAEQYMKHLELKYDLKEGELALGELPTQLELELSQSENYSKEIFDFIQSKNLFNSVLTALKYDSEELQQLIKTDSTTYASFVVKSKNIIAKYQDILNSVISTFEQTEHLIDACNIAIFIWINVCNSDEKMLAKLLSKKYIDIRDDIMQLIE